MASLKIPAEDFPALVQIAGLDDNSFLALVNAIRESKPSLSKSKHAANISIKIQWLKTEDASAILGVIFSLAHIQEHQNITAKSLAASLRSAASESEEYGRNFIDKKGDVFQSRMESLLSIDKIKSVLVKALDVYAEFERTFCSSRILSDIRPVFTDTPENVKAAIIIHNLQIGFHDAGAGEHREIYITLDDNDLEDLKASIERAQKKSIAIKALLNGSKTEHVEV